MEKFEVIRKIGEAGIIAVIRAESPEQAQKISEACIEGGIRLIEITYTVANASGIIEKLSKSYASSDVIIGAGTVLDPETARIAILAGADFVVSPYLNHELVKLCNRYQISCMAGAMTVKEAVEGMEAGADIIKIFPANLFGPAIIKAFKGPIPQMKMVPTGGVNLENIGEWLKAGAFAVGTGSELTKGAKTGNYSAITEMSRKMVDAVAKARA